jgi:hypothetical protein
VLAVLLTVKGPEATAPVAGIMGVVLGLPALAIGLRGWAHRGAEATADQVGQARESLAGWVIDQWRHEALARSLGDPQPMPVQWRLTEHAVMDRARLIMADDLFFAGRSDRIGALAKEFRGLLRRRLVILGGPGSGKTTLAVQLLLELLATPRAGDPIPVLFSLASWDPTERPQLHGWLAERLATDYPSLQAFGPDVARALAEQGHILPILDGLDELPLARQPKVITALNASLTETDQLVLTSRTREYGTAIAEAHKVLTAAAVIEPEPLTAAQAAEYLEACLPPDPGPSWRDMLDRLRAGTTEHLARVVANPLGLWLLRTVYITPCTDPRPLLTPEVARDAATMQAHLFDQLIPALLTTRPASRNPHDPFRPRRTWDSTKVRSWLTYLAQHLDKTGTRDLLWWHLARHIFSRRTFGLAVGLVAGLLAGLGFGLAGGLGIGLGVGLGVGLGAGLVAGLVAGLRCQAWLTDEPAYANLRLKHRTGMLVRDLGVGLVAGLVAGLMIGLAGGLVIGLATGHGVGPMGGAVVGVMFGVVAGLVIGMLFDLGVALVCGLVGGLTVGVGVALGVGLEVALVLGLKIGLLVGLGGGLVIGLDKWMGTPSRTGWASTPRSTYKATRALAVIQICVAGLMGGGLLGGPVGGLLGGLVGGLGTGVGVGVGVKIGRGVGLVIGLMGGLGQISSGAWLSYTLTSCRLAAAGKLPFRLMDFLDDAYRLGLLRTTGPAYQFRHAEFHDHLIRTSSSRTEAGYDKPYDTRPWTNWKPHFEVHVTGREESETKRTNHV